MRKARLGNIQPTYSWVGNTRHVSSRVGKEEHCHDSAMLLCRFTDRDSKGSSPLGKRLLDWAKAWKDTIFRTMSYSFDHNSLYRTRIQVIQKTIESYFRGQQLLWRYLDLIHLYRLTKILLKWLVMSKYMNVTQFMLQQYILNTLIHTKHPLTHNIEHSHSIHFQYMHIYT